MSVNLTLLSSKCFSDRQNYWKERKHDLLLHLAHPNVRLFITHGGLLSTQEAIQRGLPLIGIPIYGDQRDNTARIVSFGKGIRLDYENITMESVTWALKGVLNNQR